MSSLSLPQFIYGSFKNLGGGHQVAAQSSDIDGAMSKLIGRIHPNYIGDFKGSDHYQRHGIWVPLNNDITVFALFNFSGEDAIGRKGIIQMNGVLLNRNALEALSYNPFQLIDQLSLNSFDQKIETTLPPISVNSKSTATSKDSYQFVLSEQEEISALVGQYQNNQIIQRPLGDRELQYIQSLFEVLPEKGRKSLFFSTYSNKSQHKELKIIGVPDISSSNFSKQSAGVEKVVKKYISQYAYYNEPEASTDPLFRKQQSPSTVTTTVLYILGGLLAIIGIVLFIQYLSKPSTTRVMDAAPPIVQEPDKPVNKADDSAVYETAVEVPPTEIEEEDLRPVNKRATTKIKLSLRESPAGKLIKRVDKGALVFCIACLKKEDTVSNGCGDNPKGYWCKVSFDPESKEAKGWMWENCLEYQKEEE